MAVNVNCINTPLDTWNNINLITYNMHGFNQGIIELKTLCMVKYYDIVFV